MAEPASSPAIDWPVEWQPVEGKHDGPLAHVTASLVSLVLGLAARLPRRPLDLLIGTLARVGRRVDRRHADAARGFLRQALGDLPERDLEALVLDAYRTLFHVLVEPRRFALRVPPEERLARFDIAWTDDARRVLEGGSGAILVTPHLGDWEVALAVCNEVGFSPLYAVAKPPANKPLSERFQREREEWGIRLLPRRGAMADAPKVVRGGGTVALLLDQRARKRPVYAPFFGRPARCDRSAGVLLKRTQVPVLVFGCLRAPEDLHFRVEFEDCLWPDEVRGASPAEIATRLNRAFERMIRRHPEQYFWLHDRYKDTPETLPEDGAASRPEEDTRP